MALDVVIRAGTVIDGSGAPAMRADVGILGDRIVTVGKVDERGRREIDAEGHLVTPGFIDGHTHMDAQVLWDPLGTSSCWHGVTTAVMGNCGFTLAPARANERELVLRNLERAEDIAAECLEAGIEWAWESFAGYLDVVDRRPKAINYGAYVGHSALRTWAMGQRAFEERATEEDLAEMERGLDNALAAGAVGFTSSQVLAHRTSDDRPVASLVADGTELARLLHRLGRMPGTVFELALGPDHKSSDALVRRRYLDALAAVVLSAGVAVTFGVVGGLQVDDCLGFAEQVDARGGRAHVQTSCREPALVLSFATRLPYDGLPVWWDIRQMSHHDQLAAFSNADVVARLVAAADDGPYDVAMGTEPRLPDYERLVFLDHVLPPHVSVAAEAARRGVHPVEAILQRAVATDLRQLLQQRYMDVDDSTQLRLMRHPQALMTFSDAGAHVSQIADASIHTYLLAHWARDRSDVAIEDAVRMVTSAPARAWGLSDRGVVAPGMVADLNVIDIERLAPQLPEVVDDLPGGARRFVQRADGVRATLVSGVVTFEDGEHTGAFPGQLLRRRPQT